MRPLIITAIVIVLLILGKIFFFSSEEKGGPQGGKGGGPGGPGGKQPPLPVSTILVGIDQSDKIVFSSGTSIPNEEVEIRSEISGRITKLTINEGSFVQKGQLIAKIRDNDFVAQLKKIEVEEKLAAQIEARQKKLLEINAISKEEYEISLNRVSTLDADKELVKVQLEKTEIRAPFSGRIGFKNISEGAYVTPTTVIANLVQTNPIKIDFAIPEKYLSSLKNGQTVSFQIDGSNETFTSKIIAIDPKIDAVLRTLKVRAITQNPRSLFLPGMFIKVNLNLGSEQSIMIPSETIIPVLEGKKVFVKRNGLAEEVMIETGLRTDKKVQVLKGLSIGDSLITTALMTLKPGAPVFTKK
jgi:membrane fusion protein (multidrug efflux system)